MLQVRKILFISKVIFLCLAITAIAQNAPATSEQSNRGRGNMGSGNRRTATATQTVLNRTLLTGTLRFQTGGVNMYLVLGKEKALLIDTGNPGNISPEEIKSFTNLPLLVVNTHAHPDHSGSNSAFEKVYIHEADLETGKRYSGDNVELIPIKEGYVFDLGGKKLEVIEVPGHTPGSICLLDAQDKLLFGGDTANIETWAFISNLPLETYKKSMERLLKWKDQYDLLLPGHDDVLPVSYITELINCADEILTGKVDTSVQPATGGLTQGSMTHKYGSATIRYNPNNLRETNN